MVPLVVINLLWSALRPGTGMLGAVKSMTCDTHTCQLVASTAHTSGAAPDRVNLRIAFHSATTVRWWMALGHASGCLLAQTERQQA